MATDIIARGMAANAQAGGGVTESTITNALGYKPVSETDVNNAINNSSHLKRVITTTLPDVSKADKDTIYMIKVTSAKGNDKYQEYMLIDGSLQMIGDTSTDLTDYAKTEDVNSKLDSKVDKVSGKGLSTNDLTNDLKASYDKAVEQAETNKADIAILTERVDNDEEAISKINSDMVALHADNLALVFALQRTGKVYGVKAYKYPVNPTSTCEKTRDNAGLICEPSTDTVEGVDDYADIPLFKYYHCNYKRYDDGFAYPTAFEGETDYQSSGDVDIGSLQMTFYYGEIETDEYVETLISDSPNDALGLKPWELSKRADGTVMPYFIQPKYVSVTGSDGLLHSTVGRIATFQSYGNMITNYQKKGTGYWGAGSSRYTFAQIFYRIKYGTKASDDNFMGVTNWNIQYKASVQSSDKHTYFPVTNAQASNLQVGLCVSVGYPVSSTNLDRQSSTMHAYANDVKITAIETLDDNNKAVYLDCEPFTTAPLDDGREIYMSSMYAHSGDTDCVIGHHDGSPISNKDGKHPFRLQGIEYALGAYIIASDTVMFFNSDYSKDVYISNGATHTANETTIKSTYTKIGTIPASASGNGSDYWTGDVAHVGGGWYPFNEATSSTGNKDTLLAGGTVTSGSREFLQGGGLWPGSSAGLCFLLCWFGLGDAGWSFASAD